MARPEDLAQWRAHIFTSLMSALRIVALIAALPSATFSISRSMPEVALMDAVGLVWVLALWKLDRLSYTVRVYGFLALVFGVGIGTMISVGALGLSYLMAPPIIAVILLGMRPAFVALAVSAGCMLTLGLAGFSQLPIAEFPRDSFAAVAIFTLNFTCVGAFVTLMCGALLKGLSSSLNVQTRGIMYPSVAGRSSRPGTFCVHCSNPIFHRQFNDPSAPQPGPYDPPDPRGN